MKDYLKSQKIFAEHLYFYARKHKYVGRGIITWNPNEGFNLDALLESPKSYPERIELGRVRVSEKSDYCSIRIWTSDLGWALIPDVNIESLKFSLLEGNLSIKFSRIFICETCSPVSSDSSWFGNSLYRIEANRRFRDSVIVQTQVKGALPGLLCLTKIDFVQVGQFFEDPRENSSLSYKSIKYS